MPRSFADFLQLSQLRMQTVVSSYYCFFGINVGNRSSSDFGKRFSRASDKGIAERSWSDPLLKGGHHDVLIMSSESHSESPKLVQIILQCLPFPLAHIEEII